MRNTIVCLVSLVVATVSAPANCAPVNMQARSSAAAIALGQHDPILAPQERNSKMIALASPHQSLRRNPLAIQTIPVTIAVNPTSIIGGTGSATCTVTVEEVPAEGGAVLVSCDYPNILSSPSGSWPYTLNYPVGSSTSRSFTVTTNSVAAATLIRVYSCETDYDITNPLNWQAITTCTVTTAPPQ